MTVERLRAEHYDELMDFVNMVFSQDLFSVHFQEDLPLVFGRDDEHMRWQYVLRDDSGRIRTAVAAVPYTYVVDGERFSSRTITNVATHYQHTGKGYMQTVLRRVLETMREEGVDMAILTGHRDRYRFWGFESAGISVTAEYEAYNAANRAKLGETADFTFEPIMDGDRDTIRRCLELFDREPQHYLRTEENFLTFHRMWDGRAYAVRNSGGSFCGYLNHCPRLGNAVRELLLCDDSATSRVMYSFLRYLGAERIPLTISPFGEEKLRTVYNTAERITASETCRLNLLKPERLLAACLNVKRRCGGCMPEGELVIGCMFGNLLIRNDGGFTVSRTDRTSDLTVPGYEIYSLLFGPSSQVISPWSAQLGALNCWFPAPFFIHNTDRF